MKLLHKIARYTKEQKAFVLYLIVLIFFLLLFPIIKVTPSSPNIDNYYIRLVNWNFFGPMLIIFLSLAVLLWWNMSFRFKNVIINLFGFKENDALFNFGFLWVVITAFLTMGGTVRIFKDITNAVSFTKIYYIDWLLLIFGLVLTLLVLIKKVKTAEKANIVNIVDEDSLKESKSKKNLKWLFDEK